MATANMQGAVCFGPCMMPDVDKAAEIQVLRRNIQRILDERGMSKTELNRRAGLGSTAVNELFLDRARSPKLDTVIKIATALEVSVISLLMDGDPSGARELLLQEFDRLPVEQQELLVKTVRAWRSSADAESTESPE